MNNLGDDLFVITLCQRYGECIFFIIESEPYTNTFKSFKNIILCKRNEIENLKIDLQILLGGSLFMQPNDVKYIDYKYEGTVKERISSNIPFIIIGANFGPYTERKHFELYKSWFSTLDDICFRDKQSYELFKDLQNIRWAPDVVFNHKINKYKRIKAVSISCIYNNKRMGLAEYSQEKYLKQLAEISMEYIKQGFEIKLVSFCIHQEDTKAVEEIISYIPKQYRKCVRWSEYNGNNLNEFLSFFLETQYILGTRFHSIVLGWLAKVPTFPIVYNIKTDNVLKSYGFKGSYINIENIDKTTFNFIDKNRKDNYVLETSQLIQMANEQFDFLDRYEESVKV